MDCLSTSYGALHCMTLGRTLRFRHYPLLIQRSRLLPRFPISSEGLAARTLGSFCNLSTNTFHASTASDTKMPHSRACGAISPQKYKTLIGWVEVSPI